MKSAVNGATVITAGSAGVPIDSALDQAEHSSKVQTEGLLSFYQSALDGRQQLASSTNPNPQLILESLLRQWACLPLGLRT